MQDIVKHLKNRNGVRRLTGPHKNRVAIFMGPAVLPVLSAAMRLVTLFCLFNYKSLLLNQVTSENYNK